MLPSVLVLHRTVKECLRETPFITEMQEWRPGGAEGYDVRHVKKALNKIKVPSPLWGEGEDEGFFIEADPSPPTLSPEGRGGRIKRLSPEGRGGRIKRGQKRDQAR